MTPTPEQVAQWAQEAGGGECLATCPTRVVGWRFDVEELHNLATRAFAEGCAWQAEQDAVLCGALQYAVDCTPQNCAAAIRANAPKGTM